MILAELQLHRAAERRVVGQGQGSLPPVAIGLDQRAEAEPLEPLGHRAPVPSERPRRRLHIEPVGTQAVEDRGVACRVGGPAVPGR